MIKLVILCSLFSTSAYAADLNLSVGESVYIRANVDTFVTCGGANANCPSAINAFRKIMTACQSTFSGGYCVEKYWPKFKKENSSCASQAIDLCLEACEQTYSGGTCAEKCS